MNAAATIQREVYAAESYLAQEMANAATPFIRSMISRHVFSIEEDRPRRLAWLRGVWIRNKRGMILTADDRAVLWAAVEAPVPGSPIPERLSFNLHFLDLEPTDHRIR